jgi:two-component sensor histidine kinase
MYQIEESSSHTVWMNEATHRAANLEYVAMNLQRLIDRGRLELSNPPETIRRASALAKTYRSLHVADPYDPCNCAQGLKNIANGLVTIFSSSVGPVMLSLDLQPLILEREQRRALLLTASELVMNAMRHAFAGRRSGHIQITLHWEQACEEGVLAVTDDGIGPDDVVKSAGQGHGIVCGLADVLGGTVTWRRSMLLGGTEALLRFPLPTAAFELSPNDPREFHQT